MSISKAVLMGKVVRDPEKRFTQANIPVTTFTINVETKRSDGPNLVRVITWRNLAETVSDQVKKGTKVIVDGRLQVNSYKDSTGADKKGMELDAVAVEIVSAQQKASSAPPEEDLSGDVPPPSADDYNITDDLINEEEIPF